jgi:putative two-component system response regulator
MPSNNSNRDQSALLVVEDDAAMLVAFRDILESEGYAVSTAANGQDALTVLDRIQPDLILSDYRCRCDGIKLDAVRERPNGGAIPFIFITARTREDVFAARGVDDYITKPVTRQMLAAVEPASTHRRALLSSSRSCPALNAIESRDPYTLNHVEAVNAYAQALASELGWQPDELEALEFAAILHDIGKIGVPEKVLIKTGPLDPDEWEDMRRHPIYGVHMVRGTPYLEDAIPLILHHHERWDGKGYPDGLVGEDIPMGARLLAVADTFHAMTSDRPYRAAIPAEKTYEEILSQSGRQFDPKMVEAFQRCWRRGEVLRIHESARKDAAVVGPKRT